MLTQSSNVSLDESELEITAVRSQGAGGQNVNKVSSAIHLRFDIKASSLPDFYKDRLLALKEKRVTKDGVLIIKSQQFRTQEKNRASALMRLVELIKSAVIVQKVRRATKPTKNSKLRRLAGKSHRSNVKALRGKITD